MYFVRESHTPVLLERTVKAIRSHRPDLTLRTAPTAPRPSIFRPLILFVTDPTVFLSSLANAFGTALLYLFAVAFPLIYAHYALSGQKTTLMFLFIALGLFFSILTRFHDRHAIRKAQLTTNPLPPEKTLVGLAVGAPALAVGLWWFAWTIPGSHIQTLPWPASALSLVLVGYGINEYSTTLPRYVLESYFQNNNKNDDASSAFAALLIPRALLGATFPLFTRKMLQNLGTNVMGSVLAAVATAFCLVPFFMMSFGNGSRRVGSSGDGGENDASEVVVVEEEKEMEKKPKAKKTVRFWDDEEMEIEEVKSGGGVDAESGFSSSEETVVEAVAGEGDGSAVAADDDGESVDAHVAESRDGEGESEVRNTATDTGTTDDIDSAAENRRNQHSEKKEKKNSIRLDDAKDGYTSFLGLGLGMEIDVERVVGFPYL